MKPVIIFLLLSFILCCCPQLATVCTAQETTTEQQIEDVTAANDDNETEDDQWLQQMEGFRRHPINLNSADESQLKELQVLTPLQINNLFTYRRLFGDLVHVYELQAIPGWDIDLIRKILPFVTVSNTSGLLKNIGARFSGGDHSLLARTTQIVEKARGFYDSTSTGNFYPGSRQRLLVRYKYTWKNLLQYGFTAEKDAGEQLFKGAQKNGFDYYSFHFFARDLGKIKAIALGDFTVNMGQGLIQWHNLAFRKSPDAMAVKRSSPVLKPYNSAGEYNFFRGAGITLQLGRNTELTVFGSYRNRDANINVDTFQTTEDFASSLLTTGYHRTKSEIADRNALHITNYGGTLRFRKNGWQLGFNAIGTQFGNPLQKAAEPYNTYAINGKQWGNVSMDYSVSWRNLHYFGEAAADKNGHLAFVDGLMMSLDPKLDASIVVRNIAPQYQALNGNAFTESTFPVNERGIYTGLTMRPSNTIRVDAYADFYSFPFLRYRVDAPSSGRDYLLQVSAKPNKQVEVYARYKTENKAQNISGLELPSHRVEGIGRQNLRAHVAYKVSSAIQIRQRVEMVWYDKKGIQASYGFTTYIEAAYKPLLKPLSVNMRLQYFETNDYNSRIYAYESDVLYSFSIPALYGKGIRYYTNINYDLTRKLSLWLRWAQTVFQDQEVIGTGLDEIKGNKKSEFKVQMRWMF
jgi:hypothetical protein